MQLSYYLYLIHAYRKQFVIVSDTIKMLSETFIFELLGVLLTVAAVIALYYRNAFNYWKKRGVPFIKPVFPKGNIRSVLIQGLSLGIVTAEFYKEFKKRGCKFGGIYVGPKPSLVFLDLKLIKDIMSKV